MRIAIVGAGIGGLSAAVGLQRAGGEVTVFERAPELRAGGSGLSLFANGLTALQSLGLLDDVEAVTDRGVEGFAAGQRRADGRWIAQVPEVASATPEGTLTRRDRAASAADEERFDLVIGADGLHSRVRPVIDAGRAGPRYAGYSAWRGITSLPVDLSGEAGESVGHGRRFG